MIEFVYSMTLLILAVTLFALGLMFLFLNVSDNPKLAAYRNAAKAMAFTYIFFGVANTFEYIERLFGVETDNSLLFRLITIIIASAQAFLFTFAMISLINTKYMKRKRFLREIFFISLFIVFGLACYLGTNKEIANIFAYFYTAFYFSQLLRYTLMFTKLYRNCLREMDNYFSGQEAERMRWISFSFFSAFAIGIMALILALYPSLPFGIIASLACLLFYVYFAIRFVNYAFIFNTIEEVLNEETEEETLEESMPESTVNESVSALESRIAQWIADKQFTKQGITIKDTAQQLNTNRNYLSAHINQNENKTFREWINALRIDYAKKLLAENPGMDLWKIAEETGYANQSQFAAVFRKITSKTPTKYKGCTVKGARCTT
jgi:AraC-like DNA-binding protein